MSPFNKIKSKTKIYVEIMTIGLIELLINWPSSFLYIVTNDRSNK